jgi:hypothetical protein
MKSCTDLKSIIEQHAGTLSSVVTKAPDADTWEADPRFMPRAGDELWTDGASGSQESRVRISDLGSGFLSC